MWDFHHAPRAGLLRERYALHLTQPSQCARELLAGEADLGLIPIAALTPELRVVPGCTIAAREYVRSIQLVVKAPHTLESVRSVAADTASRSSVAYAQVLFRHFVRTDPRFVPAAADAVAMLREHDAALLIGDPALLALERRAAIEAEVGPCVWHDVAHLWHGYTGLPWVAAVWALRADTLLSQRERDQLVLDLNISRKNGCAHVEELVTEWTPQIAIPPATIRTYLSENIHYLLDDGCREAIRRFRGLAAEEAVLPALDSLYFLEI